MYNTTQTAKNVEAVTPNDSADLPNSARAIQVFGAGTLKVTTIGGQTHALPSVAAGFLLPWQIKRVWSTGTTATDIKALLD